MFLVLLLWDKERKNRELTQSATKQNEIEDVVSGKPGSWLNIKAAGQFPFRDLEGGRPLLGLAFSNEVEQIQALLSNHIGMLKTRGKIY